MSIKEYGPQETRGGSRAPDHTQHIQMWAAVDPTTIRMVSMISPATGQEMGALMCASREQVGKETVVVVWMNTRNGWEVAPPWMARSFTAQIEKEIMAELEREEGSRPIHDVEPL